MFQLTLGKRIKNWEYKKNTSKLIKALNTERYYYRIQAIEALDSLNIKTAIAFIIPLLDDKVLLVRKAAAKALKNLSNSEEVINTIKVKEAEWKERMLQTIDSKEEYDYSIDKENYLWKGKFKRNTVWIKIIKEQLRKPMR